PQQSRWVREHWTRVRLSKAFAFQGFQEHLCVAAAHIGIAGALRWLIAEIAPAIDNLLRRPATDTELQTTTRDQIRSSGILGHIERVLVAHVDDRSADLYGLRLGADCREKRERRGKLASKMVDTEIGAVCAEFFRCNG